MKTINTRHLLPLAAIALIAAACDPFPAKPGGDPRIVRVSTHDGNWTGNSTNVENTGASPGTVAVTGAFPLDTIYIQFNKPMKGSTLQKYADTDTTIPIDPDTVGIRTNPADPGDPAATPPIAPIAAFPDPGEKFSSCTAPTNLTLTGFEDVPGVVGIWDPAAHDFQAGTGTYPVKTSVCYNPQGVTDGAQLVITPAKALVAGTTYRVAGTVQDYEGKSLAIDVSITVSSLPVATAIDGLQAPGNAFSYAYTQIVDWFPTGAASYQLERSLDGGATWTGLQTVPASACTAAVDAGYEVCEVVISELPPDTDYLWRVREVTTPESAWRVTADVSTTRAALPVTLTNWAYPSAPSVVVEGAIQLAWGRVKGTLDATQAWIVERSPDVDPLVWTDITATLVSSTSTTGALRALSSTSRGGADVNAGPPGTVYHYRVRPNYASGTVHQGAHNVKTSYKLPPP